MAMVAADFIILQVDSPSRLACSEGWQPPGIESPFMKWTGEISQYWLCHGDSTIHWNRFYYISHEA